jgi:hypothetical protein
MHRHFKQPLDVLAEPREILGSVARAHLGQGTVVKFEVTFWRPPFSANASS